MSASPFKWLQWYCRVIDKIFPVYRITNPIDIITCEMFVAKSSSKASLFLFVRLDYRTLNPFKSPTVWSYSIERRKYTNTEFFIRIFQKIASAASLVITNVDTTSPPPWVRYRVCHYLYYKKEDDTCKMLKKNLLGARLILKTIIEVPNRNHNRNSLWTCLKSSRQLRFIIFQNSLPHEQAYQKKKMELRNCMAKAGLFFYEIASLGKASKLTFSALLLYMSSILFLDIASNLILIIFVRIFVLKSII